MDTPAIQMPQNHQVVTGHFVAACQTDERIVAAFLGGSYVTGAADAYSDLDLYLITTDAAYEDFVAGKEAFIRQLGQPLFLEDFGTPYACFFIFADETEGELWIGRESHFQHIHSGAHLLLLDKQGILTGIDFPKQEVDQAGQVETLCQQITYFWHEAFNFIKAMGREQLWFAHGQLEALRRICLNLARLRHNFSDGDVGDEPHFKLEQAMPIEHLASLQATFCPMEYEPMRQAALILFDYFREVAPALAEEHDLTYQADLEWVVLKHLERLRKPITRSENLPSQNPP